MNNLKVKLSALAIILGIGAAFASATPHAFASKKWALLSDGSYLEVTGQVKGSDYQCDNASRTCTAVYPAAQDPNTNPANPISTETGTFSN